MSARKFDTNGWFSIARNPLSKVGVFPYLGSSIGADEPDRVYMVYRPAEELADPACLDSFRTVPIIDDHTMLGSVDAGLTPVERKGVGGVTGDNVEFRDGVVYANIKVFSEALARQINSGKKQLSCGYRCSYDFSPGEFNGVKYDVVQRQLRGNHVAVVKEGRMGPDVAVLDHRFTYDHVDVQELRPVLDKDTQDAIDAAVAKATDGLAATVTQAVADALPAALAAAKAEKEDKEGEDMTDADKDKPNNGAADAALEARLAAADKQIADLKGELAAVKPTVDAMDARVAAEDKAALYDRVKPHIGAFDHAAMDSAALAAYALDKLGVKDVPAGQERATLNGYLRAKPAPTPAAMDAAPTKGAVHDYITGAKA